MVEGHVSIRTCGFDSRSEHSILFVKKVIKFILNLFPRPFLITASLKILPLLKWIFKGKKYKDPIDEANLSRFLPYGYTKLRSNALSPSTLSLERHRLLWLFLKNETLLFTDHLRLLHIAPEQAFYKKLKELPHLDYTSLDLHSPIADIKADITDMPFDDNYFDVVICNHVLEHIEDDVKAMEELYRVLTPGGISILQVPQDLNREITFEDNSIKDPQHRTEIFGQYDHVRVYGMDYFKKLSKVGFDARPVFYANQFSTEDKIRYGIQNDDIIPLAKKPQS